MVRWLFGAFTSASIMSSVVLLPQQAKELQMLHELRTTFIQDVGARIQNVREASSESSKTFLEVLDRT